jgi:hypothetical protein
VIDWTHDADEIAAELGESVIVMRDPRDRRRVEGLVVKDVGRDGRDISVRCIGRQVEVRVERAGWW